MPQLPPLDPATLGFDTCQRLSLAATVIRALPCEASSRILDVGGHPGYLARLLPEANVVTADTVSLGIAPYVRASGGGLPFAAATFDVVVASDVLEHVPALVRDDFLAELCRVSAGWILVGGPYATPGVSHAESRLRELLPSDSARFQWLDEHAQHGLPDLGKTWQTLARRGATCVAVPNGDIIEWFTLMALEPLAGGATSVPWTEFVRTWNSASALPSTDSPYRHLLVAAKAGHALPDIPNAVAEWHAPGAGRGDASPAVSVRIDALATLIKSLPMAARDKGEVPAAATVTEAYANQLERALEHQRSVIQRLEREARESAGQPGVRGMLKRVLRPGS